MSISFYAVNFAARNFGYGPPKDASAVSRGSHQGTSLQLGSPMLRLGLACGVERVRRGWLYGGRTTILR